MFFPPDWLSYAPQQYRHPLRPRGDLREAISAGRAHDDGQTTLAGRTVERIRIDPPSRCPFPSCREPSYAYVDPETTTSFKRSHPMACTSAGRSQPTWQFKIVARYLTFEYLPRTAANLALTDIVAQHPNAGGPFSKKRCSRLTAAQINSIATERGGGTTVARDAGARRAPSSAREDDAQVLAPDES